MNEEALQVVVRKMATCRPGLDRGLIRRIVECWLRGQREPLAEVEQDVVWAYQRVLESLSP